MAAQGVAVITPHDVALCVLVRAYLSPGPEGPPLASPLRPALGQALLSELRGGEDGIRLPRLEELLQRIQVRAATGCRRASAGAARLRHCRR